MPPKPRTPARGGGEPAGQAQALTPAQKRRLRKKKLEEKNAQEAAERAKAEANGTASDAAPAKAATRPTAPSSPASPAAPSTAAPSSDSDSESSSSSSASASASPSSSDNDSSDSEEANIITPTNFAQKRSIAALSARQVLQEAEERRKALLESEDEEEGNESEEEQKGKAAKKKRKGAEEEMELTINKEFAAKYEEQKRKQMLSKKASRGDTLAQLMREKVLGGGDSSSDEDMDDDDELLADARAQLRAKAEGKAEEKDSDESSSDDSDGELLNEELDGKIERTLEAIRAKRPEVYQKDKAFFSEEDIERARQEALKRRAKETKGMSVTQLMAQQLLGKKDPLKEQKGSDDSSSSSDDSDEDEALPTRQKLQNLSGKAQTLTYSQQQEAIKQAFLRDAEAEDDGDDDEDMFLVKKKAVEDSDDEDKPPAAASSSSSTSAPLPKSDTEFLRSYLSGQWWKEKDLSKLPSYRDIRGEELPPDVSASEDEDELDKVDTFEEAYNFRFEEGPHATRIQSHPRPQQITDSLRNTVSKRKLAREAAKKHKEEERTRKKQEIARLKAEKKKELQAKLGELHAIAGLDAKKASSKLDVNTLLDTWDPAQHDALMASLFDDEEFYANAADDAEMDEETFRAQVLQGEDLEALGMGRLPVAEGEGGKGKKKRKLDPDTESKVEELTTAVKRDVDRLQQLDYEDLVGAGGDLAPTRFKYREVAPESFGFTLEELLTLPDAVLNSRVSLKKLAAYRDSFDEPDAAMPHVQRRAERMRRQAEKDAKREAWKKRGGGAQHSQKKKEKKKEDKPKVPPPAPADPTGPLTAAQKRRLRKKKLEQFLQGGSGDEEANGEPASKKQKTGD